MSTVNSRRGRPSKYAKYDRFYASLPESMRRPKYLDRIGVRRGSKGDSVWVKVQLPHGGAWQGSRHAPGTAVEIKLGRKSSVTWQDAIDERDELQRRADNDLPLEDTVIPTFEVWASDWIERKKGTTKRPDTLQVHLRAHLLPEFGLLRVDQITPAAIERWIARLRSQGRKPGYIKRMVNTLKSVLNDAKREGFIDENPATKIDKVKGVTARDRYLTSEEIVRLLDAAQQVDAWLYDACVFAMHSGMRRGELQMLRWPDVRELDSGTAIVVIRDSKSGNGRVVTCTDTMKEILLRRLSESQSAEHRAGEGGEEGDGPVDDRVWPVSAMTWRRRWEKSRKLAGLEDVTFHDLRRTNATRAAASGVDMRTLAGRIGHRDLSMLERHYAVLEGSAEMKAAQQIQRSFDELDKLVVLRRVK